MYTETPQVEFDMDSPHAREWQRLIIDKREALELEQNAAFYRSPGRPYFKRGSKRYN